MVGCLEKIQMIEHYSSGAEPVVPIVDPSMLFRNIPGSCMGNFEDHFTDDQKLENLAGRLTLSRNDSWEVRRMSLSEYNAAKVQELRNFKLDVNTPVPYDIGNKKAIQLFRNYCMTSFIRKHIIVGKEGLSRPLRRNTVDLSGEELSGYGNDVVIQHGSRLNHNIVYFFYEDMPEQGVLLVAPDEDKAEDIYFRLMQESHIMTYLLQHHQGKVVGLKQKLHVKEKDVDMKVTIDAFLL